MSLIPNSPSRTTYASPAGSFYPAAVAGENPAVNEGHHWGGLATQAGPSVTQRHHSQPQRLNHRFRLALQSADDDDDFRFVLSR